MRGEVPLTASPQVTGIRRLALDLERLEDILGDGDPTLVTCTAVLDVLTEAQVRSLATLLAERRLAVLFSLSVTGEVLLQPPLDLDARIETTFNEHQRRSGLAGPLATAIAAEEFSAHGMDVTVVETPWVLSSGSEELLNRYLTDRVRSAVEHDPTLAAPAQAWLKMRLSQLINGSLRVQVNHQDLVALPRF